MKSKHEKLKKQAEAEIEIKKMKVETKESIPDQMKIENSQSKLKIEDSQSKFLNENSAASYTPQTADIEAQTNRPILQEQSDSSQARMEME